MRYLHCLHTNYSRTPIRFLLCISCTPPLRSPLLGIVSGSVAASLLAYAVFRVTMFPTQVAKMIDGSVGEVLTAPLISSGFTCVYGARGLRLLVMHDRHLRGRWIRVLEERAVIKGLVAAFLAIGGIAWSAILLYGLNRRVMSHRTDVGRDKNIFAGTLSTRNIYRYLVLGVVWVAMVVESSTVSGTTFYVLFLRDKKKKKNKGSCRMIA